MTEWTKQAEEMFKSWSETQKGFMDKWAESVKSFSGSPDTEMWKKTLETWEETAKSTFSSQAEWTQSWVENLKSIEGMPEQAVESVDKFQEMAGRWGATQEELWAKWFEMVKGLDFSQASDTFSEAMQNPLKSWQDATKKVMDAQADWMKIWTGTKED
ncbi:MAG: hypothetical protein ISR58_16345 [Anaerolineales bacterium]|nr:hypothetical protein [Chloroflexota bacterium]MBL6982745.1 hypothetical protein [Anaerolineales bacterium]